MRQVGDFPSLGNNGDFEVFVRQICNRQANPLDRHRALKDEITRDFGWVGNPEGPRVAVIFDGDKLAAAVDVTLNHVSAEASRWSYGSFEIHRRAGFETTESRTKQRFARHVGGK